MVEFLYHKILIVGPSSKRKGGIASVLKLYKENINANYLSSTNFQNTFLSFLFLPIQLLKFVILVNKKNICLIHIHSSAEGSFYRKYLFFKLGRLFNKKILFHIHSGRFENFYMNSSNFIRHKIKKLIEASDGIIILSTSKKNFYEKNFNLKRIWILGNIISNPDFNNKKIIEGKKIEFVFLGKIFKEKGIYDLLDCIFQNYEGLKNKAKFIIAGNGEEEKTLSYKNKDYYNIIEFTGWLNQNQKNNLLTKSHVLILPSYSEGLPVSILEAMSFKMGIIATPVGGIPDLITNGENGYLIEAKSKKNLEKAIFSYINDREKILAHGEKNSEKIKNFFPKSIKKRLFNIYAEILNNE